MASQLSAAVAYRNNAHNRFNNSGGGGWQSGGQQHAFKAPSTAPDIDRLHVLLKEVGDQRRDRTVTVANDANSDYTVVLSDRKGLQECVLHRRATMLPLMASRSRLKS